MVGFAVGNREFSLEDFSIPARMTWGFESAHKLLFTLAVSQLTGDYIADLASI